MNRFLRVHDNINEEGKSITICNQRLIWQFLNYYTREKDNSREKKEHVTKVDESVHVKNSEKIIIK